MSQSHRKLFSIVVIAIVLLAIVTATATQGRSSTTTDHVAHSLKVSQALRSATGNDGIAYQLLQEGKWATGESRIMAYPITGNASHAITFSKLAEMSPKFIEIDGTTIGAVVETN